MNLLKFITPLNLQTEKEKFFTNDSYNPIFRYYWQEEEPMYTTYGNKLDMMKAIFDQDVSNIHKYAGQQFEIGSWEHIDSAKEILKVKPGRIPSEGHTQIIEKFAKAFNFLGLSDYKLSIVDTLGFNFRPLCHKRVLQMSKYANFEYMSVDGEIRHELVHIIRYENGIYNKIPRSDHYLPTEEGLATFMQDKDDIEGASQYQHAAEYMASRVGLSGSLRDIYNHFIGLGFSEDLAWQRASRHKFGFVDTKEPGDILKPAMYFANAQRVKKLSEKDLLNLFKGKVAIGDIESTDDYTGNVPENKLRHFYNI